jgi:alkylation response protein AidB-like acyl-CoA dehydrogenase
MDFQLPAHLPPLLQALDDFIDAEIKPLEQASIQFFDKRREHARTNWEDDGTPTKEWEELLAEMRRRADAAGFLRYGLPVELGGKGGSNLDMAVKTPSGGC